MRKEEQFPWKYATRNIRVLDMKWLFPNTIISGKHAKNDHIDATNFMNHFLRWVYNVIIIPLIRCSFYVTETEFTGKKLLYYRKPIWSKIKNISTKQLLERQYKKIPISEAYKRLRTQQMGCSTLRLLPKMTGIRPVVNLCKRQNIGFVNVGDSMKAAKMKIGSGMKFLSTNWMLRDTKDILDFERKRNPSLLGAGVFGSDDFYHRLCDFVVNLKRWNNEQLPELYFASVDISKCYDNIRTDYLFDEIIVDIMKEEEYLIRRHSIIHSLYGNNMFRKKVISEVDMPGNHKKFQTTAHRLAGRYTDSIMMEGVTCSVTGKQRILDSLLEHLSSHVLISSRKNSIQFLLQTNGIPQGR
jgi:telomerase reverse transcriptase